MKEITEEQIREVAKSEFTNARFDDYGTDLNHEFCDAFVAGAKWMQEQQPEWISVKDRLPLANGFVICIKTSLPHVIGLYFNSDERFKYATKDHTRDVTHWMPLPEPPKS